MKTPRSTIVRHASVVCLGLGLASSTVADSPAGYHDHDALTSRLRELVQGRERVATLESIGRSFESRDLWALTLGQPEPGKPAIYLDAAHDGTEVTASEIALGAAEWLLESYAPDSLIDLLDRVTLHIVPRANPDGCERAFATPYREQPLIPRPHDADRDERIDEDGPEDVNDDGEIVWMRVLDPAGSHTADPAAPRLLVERELEDEGPFYRVYREGRDADDDWLVNEDPEGGVALLHNFPQGWEIEPVQPGAGPYAASERETVALLEYFVAHPEIGTAITLSQGDRPEKPGVGTPGYLPDADGAIFDALDHVMNEVRGRKLDADFESPGSTAFGGAGQLLPPPPQGSSAPRGKRAVVPGSFLEWAYYQHGAFALSPQVWVTAPAVPETASADTTGTEPDSAAVETTPDEDDENAKEPRDADEKAWLDWIDATDPTAFQDWTVFTHETLGEVELGGFTRAPRHIAPRAAVDSLAEETARLLVALAAEQPRLRVAGVSVEPMAQGLSRVRVTVENSGRLPTMSARGADARLFHPMLAEIELPSGRTLVDTPARASLGRLGPGERRTVEWIIAGTTGTQATVTVWSVRAGRDTETISLTGSN